MLRRHFIKNTVLTTAGMMVLARQLRAAGDGLTDDLSNLSHLSLDERIRSETLWRAVGRHFNPADDFINLEYGYFSPSTLQTLDQELADARMVNARASHYFRREMYGDVERVRAELADMAGVLADEVCLTRNTTESMNIVINGLDTAPGDEIIYGDQDYGSMIQVLRMKSARYGVTLKRVKIPLHPASDDEIVNVYEEAITPRTRLLHMTHMYNYSGQVIPVRKICDMGHRHGIESVVDAAHTFAHINYTIPELNCDYFAASLHKWLCAPVGLGILYVKAEKIPDVWPLFGDVFTDRDDIRKLEHMGTRPVHQVLALSEAIRFYRILGADLREGRLRYLSRRWMDQVRGRERVVVNTPADPARHGALGNVGIKGVDSRDLASFFLDRHHILTVEKSMKDLFTGVRVTPGIPTPSAHADGFVEAIDDALQHFD
jgi:selenocysteine lyase/cysteine desulfurase